VIHVKRAEFAAVTGDGHRPGTSAFETEAPGLA